MELLLVLLLAGLIGYIIGREDAVSRIRSSYNNWRNRNNNGQKEENASEAS